VATIPLVATLVASPAAAADGQYGDQGPSSACSTTLCAGSVDAIQLLVRNLWVVGEPLAITWHFATPAGAAVGGDTYTLAQTATLALSYSSSGGWRVAPLPRAVGGGPDPQLDLCAPGAWLLDQTVPASLTVRGKDPLGSDGAAGCLFELADAGGGGQGHVLWRFGALLAADGPAHAALPTLPVVPSTERAALGI
jgi:hypothetical protein